MAFLASSFQKHSGAGQADHLVLPVTERLKLHWLGQKLDQGRPSCGGFRMQDVAQMRRALSD